MTEIYSMSFDQESAYFGLTSVRGTLHIFELEKSSPAPNASKPEDPYSPSPSPVEKLTPRRRCPITTSGRTRAT